MFEIVVLTDGKRGPSRFLFSSGFFSIWDTETIHEREKFHQKSSIAKRERNQRLKKKEQKNRKREEIPKSNRNEIFERNCWEHSDYVLFSALRPSCTWSWLLGFIREAGISQFLSHLPFSALRKGGCHLWFSLNSPVRKSSLLFTHLCLVTDWVCSLFRWCLQIWLILQIRIPLFRQLVVRFIIL